MHSYISNFSAKSKFVDWASNWIFVLTCWVVEFNARSARISISKASQQTLILLTVCWYKDALNSAIQQFCTNIHPKQLLSANSFIYANKIADITIHGRLFFIQHLQVCWMLTLYKFAKHSTFNILHSASTSLLSADSLQICEALYVQQSTFSIYKFADCWIFKFMQNCS